MTNRLNVLLCALLLAVALPRVASALTAGNLKGRVTDKATGKPLSGVTVVVSAQQGEQTEFTDSSGNYLITDIPPGEVVVRFYFSNVKVDRPGVVVQADKTLTVDAAIPTGAAKEQRYTIKASAPVVDVATTQVQTQVTDELVRNVPTGRTYSSVLTLTPGSATDAVGFSFNGATGPENQFLIDGLNTTNPSHGLLGSPMTLEFIKETEIITGGYNAEFGRATGGIVNVVTKSGSNQFHGGAWFFGTPVTLDPPRIARPGEAVARISRRVDGSGRPTHLMDFGMDLGGPIVKDRLWFYVGFAPTFSTANFERILRRRTSNDFDPTVSYPNDTYLGDLDTSIQCPSYLRNQNAALCKPATAAAFKTEDIDRRLSKTYASTNASYNVIGKLNLRINENNQAAVTYIAGPQTFQGVSASRFNGNPVSGVYEFNNPSETHDIVAHYVSKLFDHRLLLDFRVGWHFEKNQVIPSDLGASQGSNTDTRTNSLVFFEDELEPCKVQRMGTKNIQFNPCPVTNYRDAGFGFLSKEINQRAVVAASATYFLKALGSHAIKLGGDFEYNYYQNYRSYTGGANGGAYTTFGDAANIFIQRQQYGQVDPNDPTRVILFNGENGNPLGFTATTTTLNNSLYLRDSWNPSFIPGFTVNLGLRWEAQQVKDVNGATQIGIYDNWAPRVGLVWDFLGQGRSKLFFNYGRFYESIPLDINDRQFSGEGLVIQDLSPGDKGACKGDANGRVDLNTCKFATPTRDNLFGGTYGVVSPGLQGQYSNEVVLGAQWAPGYDIVLGASYTHRDLGRIIEDVSADGGRTYVIANPGVPTDPGTVRNLQTQIDGLNRQIAGTTDPARVTELRKKVGETSQQLSLYNAAAAFETPRRNYDALTLTISKRLSYNFIVLASYTYSRTIGNYPGLFQASNGQLDPNISTQYDLPELLVNRNGPLPNDRPHNLKITGAYTQSLKQAGSLTLGINFFVQSGTPIEVLGRHPTYGANETFILPRGAGGRTPPIAQLDVHIGWGKTFTKGVRAELSMDCFNITNSQAATNVDMQYTADRVLPIPNGSYESLTTLKTTSGTVPRLNPNYGQATAYQTPLSLRFGARISF